MGQKDVAKNNDKKSIYYAETPDEPETEEAGSIDYQDSDYEVLMAAAEDIGLEPEHEIFEESEAKEILATMVRDALKGGNKGYGKGFGKRTFANVTRMKKTKELSREYGSGRTGIAPGTYKVSIEELKSRTRCGHCKAIGHWHRECPLKKSGSSSKEVQLLETDEAMFVHFLEFQDYKANHGHEAVAEVHHLQSSEDWNPLDVAVQQWRSERQVPTGPQVFDNSAASQSAYKERHQASHKRSRAMDCEEPSTVTMQRWRHLMLRVLMLVNQAMQHLVSGRLNMTGFKGYRLQQMARDLPLLETSELEDLMQLCQEQIQSRQMDELDGFSIISGQTLRSQLSLTSKAVLSSDGDLRESSILSMSTGGSTTDHLQGRSQLSTPFLAMPQVAEPHDEAEMIGYHQCPHHRTTQSGSNGWITQTKCLDCGKLLEKVSKTGPKATSSREPIPSESEQELWEQFQAFQRLRRGSQGSK
ncbi:unnamed protein product [Durusdinium trenchii]|uniref:CCHC-type domain-containing protein n=1 Tax=Durusdinium trenchii TaxID=1381693 RepID=A0ABP0S3U4_9DINO